MKDDLFDIDWDLFNRVMNAKVRAAGQQRLAKNRKRAKSRGYEEDGPDGPAECSFDGPAGYEKHSPGDKEYA